MGQNWYVSQVAGRNIFNKNFKVFNADLKELPQIKFQGIQAHS